MTVSYKYFSRVVGDIGAVGSTNADLASLYNRTRDAGDILYTDNETHANGLIESTIWFKDRPAYDKWYSEMVQIDYDAPTGTEFVGDAIEPE